MATAFDRWLDTFLSEKGHDLETVLEVEGPSGTNWIPLGCLVEMIKGAPKGEQAAIKTTLVKIDFANGDALHFMRHLARAVAK
jgi:hypothetical protein